MFNFINKVLHVMFDPAEYITAKKIQPNNWVAGHLNKKAVRYLSQKVCETGKSIPHKICEATVKSLPQKVCEAPVTSPAEFLVNVAQNAVKSIPEKVETILKNQSSSDTIQSVVKKIQTCNNMQESKPLIFGKIEPIYANHFSTTLPIEKLSSQSSVSFFDYIYDSANQYKESLANFLWDNKETIGCVAVGCATAAVFGTLAYKYWYRNPAQKQASANNEAKEPIAMDLTNMDLETALRSIHPTLSESFIKSLNGLALESIQSFKGVKEALNLLDSSVDRQKHFHQLKITFAQEVASKPLSCVRYEKSSFFLKAGLVDFIKERAANRSRVKP